VADLNRRVLATFQSQAKRRKKTNEKKEKKNAIKCHE
jgi:hypothetical protein